MKKLLAVLALAVLPAAASAQAGPRVIGPEPGITVQGHGAVKVAVKTLLFAASARGNVDEKSALAAMRAAGIVDPLLGSYGPTIVRGNPTLLRGTIPSVTQEKLDKIGAAATEYMRQHSGTTIENITFTPRLDDCAASEQAARVAAFADARHRAQAIAALAGLAIGGVGAVSEFGGCPTADGQQFGPAGQTFDLGTLTATVTVNETITFTASPPGGARRQPL